MRDRRAVGRFPVSGRCDELDRMQCIGNLPHDRRPGSVGSQDARSCLPGPAPKPPRPPPSPIARAVSCRGARTGPAVPSTSRDASRSRGVVPRGGPCRRLRRRRLQGNQGDGGRDERVAEVVGPRAGALRRRHGRAGRTAVRRRRRRWDWAWGSPYPERRHEPNLVHSEIEASRLTFDAGSDRSFVTTYRGIRLDHPGHRPRLSIG